MLKHESHVVGFDWCSERDNEAGG